MFLAELTILLGFHPVRMKLLVFCEVVISLFAFLTRKGNLYAHN